MSWQKKYNQIRIVNILNSYPENNNSTVYDLDRKTYLNEPIIKERLRYFQTKGCVHVHLELEVNQSELQKYAIERKDITYASGICVKMYNENLFE